MKQAYRKGPASRPGPQSCAGDREAAGEALTGVHIGPDIEFRNHPSDVPTLWLDGECKTIAGDNREPCVDVKEPKNLGMCGNPMRENRETLPVPLTDGGGGRPEKAERPK